jgi:phosphomannomutase
VTTPTRPSPTLSPELRAAVLRWRDDDVDPTTQGELDALLAAAGCDPGAAAAAVTALADAFAGTLEFGTAGLRGALGAGPNRMNRAVVIAAAAGLTGYLWHQVNQLAAGGSRRPPKVVIGYDARHSSDVFARDTAAVVTAAGGEALLLPRRLPTPVLAFAVRQLRADAGVMVTASHNPPQDNGYKVYLGGRVDASPGQGAQIVPPADAGIAEQIAAVGPARAVPRSDGGWRVLDDTVVADYLAAITALVRPGPRDLDVVLTPLHGVGGEVARQALVAAGFGEPYLVPQQAEPDPEFPTVAFPNPEEAGAIDLALAAARERGADLVLANDPDADRCAVAVPTDTGTGSGAADWRMLTGDELGALLGEHLLASRGWDDPVVACSIVSSQLLARIAAAHGARHEQTLTGFKWISRVAGLRFGYEEALGYCVAPEVVRDKDGISAALMVCELAASLKAQGRSLLDALDDLAVRHGVHATSPLPFRVADLSLIGAAMARLRATPLAVLGGQPVTGVDDLAEGDGGLPPTDGLRYRTDGGIRVVVRPSGTEPKLKCYLEVVVPVEGGRAGLVEARRRAAELLAAVRTDLTAILGPD